MNQSNDLEGRGNCKSDCGLGAGCCDRGNHCAELHADLCGWCGLGAGCCDRGNHCAELNADLCGLWTVGFSRRTHLLFWAWEHSFCILCCCNVGPLWLTLSICIYIIYPLLDYDSGTSNNTSAVARQSLQQWRSKNWKNRRGDFYEVRSEGLEKVLFVLLAIRIKYIF
jgi:hypothetical protein